jgi:hypothetical protein
MLINGEELQIVTIKGQIYFSIRGFLLTIEWVNSHWSLVK